MAAKERLIVDSSDVLAVRFTCGSCEASASVPVGGANDHGVTSCPNCGTAWPRGEWMIARDFLVAMRHVASTLGANKPLVGDRKPYRIALEIERP